MRHLATEQVPTPHTTEFYRMRALGEAETRVRDLKLKLEDVNREMYDFRTEHTVCLGSQIYFKSGSITGRAALDAQWRELVVKQDQLLQQWNQALAEYASVKSQST